MADFVSKEKRSKIMASIRGKWTSQEKLVHNMLKSRKIGHKMHPKLNGNPDILIKKQKLVVFLDGCFWHGCPKCYKAPASKMDYWSSKLERNRSNDRRNNSILRKMGYKVLRLWEHDLLKNLNRCLDRMIKRKS